MTHDLPKKRAAATIGANTTGALIRDTEIFAPPDTVGIAIEKGAKDYTVENVPVTGGGAYAEYVDSTSGNNIPPHGQNPNQSTPSTHPSIKSTKGWSRAYEQNSIFGKTNGK